MAYRQTPARGQSDSYASFIDNGLINGDSEKTKPEDHRVVATGPSTPEIEVEGHTSNRIRPKGTGTGYNIKGEVIASVKPEPGVSKPKLNLGVTPNDPKPKTKVKEVESVPYGANYSNKQLKAKMKQHGAKWQGREKSLDILGSIEKADDEKSSQTQITQTRTTQNPFTFTK
jgi:hypothetical protein